MMNCLRCLLSLLLLSGAAPYFVGRASAQDSDAELQAQDDAPEPPPEGDGSGAIDAPLESRPPPPPPPVGRETNCNDRSDDDGDSMIDCADADCYGSPACQFGQGAERSDQACSDWIDNDGDGAIDCEDDDCGGNGITVCHGSVEQPTAPHTNRDGTVPGLEGISAPEELIGSEGDPEGERNDYTCSDGVDNDGDGRTDCEDYGCRFDPQVTVCTVSPGFRASVVAGIGFATDIEALRDDNRDSNEAFDVSFRRLQLRLLGSIPYINNSFFLLSMRLERSVRLTFAHFQVPIGDRGHYFAINSGGGGLSANLIISTAKQPLLDAPFYVTNAFEEGNGAALEVGGPLTANQFMTYRLFLAGGSGRSNGNVGGRFFPDDNENFTYTAGGQVTFNLIGYFNRLDTPMLYQKSPLGLAFMLGAKYDQRARERYPAAHAMFQFRHSYFLIRAENYFKYSIDFGGSVQNSWNAQANVLIWPRNILLSADIGMYTGEDFTELTRDDDLDQVADVFQWRVALHWYWFRNIGTLSLLYSDRLEQGRAIGQPGDGLRAPDIRERELRLEAQFRF